mmetsp:Transcript_38683/g.76154  ORF Transcript_38683/g.76154 Transcript_38683/m.76154 type:complete len:242 (+) Transcript_38683:1084-1809(+)
MASWGCCLGSAPGLDQGQHHAQEPDYPAGAARRWQGALRLCGLRAVSAGGQLPGGQKDPALASHAGQGARVHRQRHRGTCFSHPLGHAQPCAESGVRRCAPLRLRGVRAQHQLCPDHVLPGQRLGRPVLLCAPQHKATQPGAAVYGARHQQHPMAAALEAEGHRGGIGSAVLRTALPHSRRWCCGWRRRCVQTNQISALKERFSVQQVKINSFGNKEGKSCEQSPLLTGMVLCNGIFFGSL